MEARYINQAFSAGVPTVVPVGGRFFRVLSNVNPFVLEVGFGGQYSAKLEDAVTGDWGRCRDGQESFTSLRVTTAGAETVKILITDGEIGRDSANLDVSDRAARLLGIVYGTLGQAAQELLNGVNAWVAACKGTLGTLAQVAVNAVNYLRVQIQGQGDAETNNNNAFVRQLQQPAVGAQFSAIQCKNPAASGKVVYIDRIHARTGNAADLYVGRDDTDLATNIGTFYSRDVGGVASAAQLRRGSNAATALTEVYANRQNPATEHKEFIFNPPLKLGAGEGVIVEGGIVNTLVDAEFHIREY